MPRVTRLGRDSTASDADIEPVENPPSRPPRQARPTMKAVPLPPPLPILKSIPNPKPIDKKRPRAITVSNLPIPKATKSLAKV